MLIWEGLYHEMFNEPEKDKVRSYVVDMRFRMAMHFPNLSMMGGHGFTKLMSAPGAIEDALEDMVGAK